MNKRIVEGGILIVALTAFVRCAPPKYPDGVYAEVRTNKGLIVLRLEFEKTPMTVSNFVGLAEGTIANAAFPKRTPYFDGTAWHRVVSGHVIQCGLPKSDKAEDPGYQFPDEIHPDLNHDRAGEVGMANGGPHTNGSQWYITLGDRSYLDGLYTVFGHVIQGLDVVKAIVQNDIVQSVKIIRVGRAAKRFHPTTASFQKMAEEAAARVKEADAKRKADEETLVAKNWPNAIAGESGLKSVILKDGTGQPPTPGQKIKAIYSGKGLLRGPDFVSTADDGVPYRGETAEPFAFEVGKTKIHPGLETTLALMKKGEKRLVIIPAEMGYKTNGFFARQRPHEKRFVIPPNTVLVYEIERLE
jgi:cyclophilin family peptidyl-prolyl cis-trans isomerase